MRFLYPIGLTYFFFKLSLFEKGSGLGKAYIEEIMQLLSPIGITGVADGAGVPDLGMWDADIPKGSLYIDRSKYFWFHHTHGNAILVYHQLF